MLDLFDFDVEQLEDQPDVTDSLLHKTHPWNWFGNGQARLKILGTRWLDEPFKPIRWTNLTSQ